MESEEGSSHVLHAGVPGPLTRSCPNLAGALGRGALVLHAGVPGPLTRSCPREHMGTGEDAGWGGQGDGQARASWTHRQPRSICIHTQALAAAPRTLPQGVRACLGAGARRRLRRRRGRGDRRRGGL